MNRAHPVESIIIWFIFLFRQERAFLSLSKKIPVFGPEIFACCRFFDKANCIICEIVSSIYLDLLGIRWEARKPT